MFTKQSHPLCPHLSETELVKRLVSQYLEHDSFAETSQAFLGEIAADEAALLNKSDVDDQSVAQGSRDAQCRQCKYLTTKSFIP